MIIIDRCKDGAPDDLEFLQVLQVNNLVALNADPERHCSQPFKFGTRQAQLDYIITRHRDAKARRAIPLHDCLTGGWRKTGGYHVPVVASIHSKIAVPQRKTAQKCPIDRE